MKINEKQLRNVIQQVIKENNKIADLSWLDSLVKDEGGMEKFKGSLIAYDAHFGNGQLINFLRDFCGERK